MDARIMINNKGIAINRSYPEKVFKNDKATVRFISIAFVAQPGN